METWKALTKGLAGFRMGDEVTGVNSIQSRFFPLAAKAFSCLREAVPAEAVPEVEEAFRELDKRDCVMLDPNADVCLYPAAPDPDAAYCIWFKVGSGIGGRVVGLGLTESGGSRYLPVRERVTVEFLEDGLHIDVFGFVSVNRQILELYQKKHPAIIHEASLELTADKLDERALKLEKQARAANQPETGISLARRAAMRQAAALARKEAAEALAELEEFRRPFSS